MRTSEAIAFNETELLELEMIVADEDSQAALEFLKRSVWRKVQKARGGRLRCHLNSGGIEPVREYQQKINAEEN
jgi:hypothetical protein